MTPGAGLRFLWAAPWTLVGLILSLFFRRRSVVHGVVVAEGATPVQGEETVRDQELDAFGHVKLGGIGVTLEREIDRYPGVPLPAVPPYLT